MSDTNDRVYWLFAEANPAPKGAEPTTKRPLPETIIEAQRNPIMLTQPSQDVEPGAPSPNLRRWRGPAVALAMFALVAVVGIAALFAGLNGRTGVANDPTLSPVTTSDAAVTSTVPPTTFPTGVVPGVVAVPELSGLTLGDARIQLGDLGLEIVALPADVDSAVILAQEPTAGSKVEAGTTVTVDVQIIATCDVPDAAAPGVGQTTISVLFECGSDYNYPTVGIALARIVPEQGGEPIDRIEWTLRSVLAGPTDDERAVGFESFFSPSTADALNTVTLTDGRLVVDFNEAIIVNNMSTSTGGLFFNAELQRNAFQHPEVDSVEFHFNGDCEAWSAFFESDGCWVITRSDWDQRVAEWTRASDQ